MRQYHIWTEAEVGRAVRILGEHTKRKAALAHISQSLGRLVTEPALQAQLKKLGLTIDACLLETPEEEKPAKAPKASKPAPEPVHPVTEAERREEQKREKVTTKQLVEELRVARARQAFIDAATASHAPPCIFPRLADTSAREMTAVVMASDWHVEEPVDAESVAYRNEYNLDIAELRIEKFFRGIVWNVEHQRASGRIRIDDLVLWLGGDLMTGYIHPELVESNLLSPTETVRWLLPRLRDGIATLLKHLNLDRLVVPCSFGNHGRTTDKPRVSTGYANSYEWLMYHSLADSFQGDSRVQFEITNSPHQYVQVYDWTLHFHHGDDVKYQGGVGGLGIPLLKAVPMWDLIKPADVHCIGHHHTLRDYGRAVVNGSLIGYGPYSQRIRAPFESPGQMMFYMDRERGKSMVTHLWVD